MSDREILELAAKAAGIHVHHWFPEHDVLMCSTVEGGDPDYGWNPITSNDDAFQLLVILVTRWAVTLLHIDDGETRAAWRVGNFWHYESTSDNVAAARRRRCSGSIILDTLTTIRNRLWYTLHQLLRFTNYSNE